LRDEPQLAGVWSDLARVAGRIDRFDIVLDANRHLADLTPSDPAPRLGTAAALLNLNKLEEARADAEMAADLAESAGAAKAQTEAHVLLARIALARRDADRAREEAELADSLDATLPLATYVEGRLLYDHGRYAEAWP